MEISVKGGKTEAPKEDTTLVVQLLKHHTPSDKDNDKVVIVGHKQPAKYAKLATGGSALIEPEKFIKGEMAPAPVIGALNGSSSEENIGTKKDPKYIYREWRKIWAGTYVEMPASMAYDLIDINAAKLVRPDR